MENTKIYVMSDNQKIYSQLVKTNESKFNFDFIGGGLLNKDSLNQVILAKPNILLITDCDLEVVTEIVKSLPSSETIMLTKYVNNAQNTQIELSSKGMNNFSFIDLERFGPIDVLQTLKEQFGEEWAFDELPSMEVPTETTKVVSTTPTVSDNSPTENDASSSSVSTEDVDNILKNVVSSQTTSSSSDVLMDNTNPFEEDRPKPKVDYSNIALRTKTVALVSKSGGTGKSTIAREISNHFSKIKVKNINKDKNDKLKVCLFDLDFDRGSQRTQLGVTQSSPNVYEWIDDIVTRVERGVSIDNIRYSSIQVMSQYVRKIEGDNNLYVLLSPQGDLPTSLYERLESIGGNIMNNVIAKIINSLKGIFDLLIIDTPSTLDEISATAMQLADTNLLVVTPSISNFENSKVLLDQIQNIEGIDPSTFAWVINKDRSKTGIDGDMDDILNSIFVKEFDFEKNVETKKKLKMAGRILYEPTLLYYENSFTYASDHLPALRKSLNVVCEYILPIFKAKITQKEKKKLKTSKEIKLEKDKMLERMVNDEDTQRVLKSVLEKDNGNKSQEQLTPSGILLEENGKGKMSLSNFNKLNFKGYNITKFVETLRNVDNIERLKNGFPVTNEKPENLEKKVWKMYSKILSGQKKRTK